MRYLFTLLFSMVFVLGAFSQALTIDTTFKPFIDLRCCGAFAGSISDVWEEPKSGKLFVAGNFRFATPNKESHGGITSMHRDGSRNFQFKGAGGLDPIRFIRPRKNNTLLLSTSGKFFHINHSGKILNWPWINNFRKSGICCFTWLPYFYGDGSSLLSSGLGNPGSCKIHTPTDTFPHQYLIKFDSSGRWDSTFKHESNYDAEYFIPYDSKRLFIQGPPSRLTAYDGEKVNGLFRIYLDGTLDTTFQVNITADFGNHIRPVHVQNDGTFFLFGGGFLLSNFPHQKIRLAKFHPNGALDAAFTSQHNLKDTIGIPGEINSIVATPDKGYIIAGRFDSIQGYAKHDLAKLDSLGNVEPQYFTSHGPDTAHHFGAGREWVKIKKSAFGGYYVYGDFISWDGKPVQPIVRLKGLTVGIKEQKAQSLKASIYPNPSKGEIQLATKARLQSISVYNIQGQKVQEINPSKRKWDLPQKYGLYLIRLQDDNGNYYTKKIIKN